MQKQSAGLLVLALLFSFSTAALAEGTHTWQQSKYDELEKGTAKGVAIRSQGGLELAPAFKAIYTTPSTYLWSIAADAQGNVYAAAGAPARVYRVTPQGHNGGIVVDLDQDALNTRGCQCPAADFDHIAHG